MQHPSHCELCGATMGGVPGGTVAGLTLCAPCHRGDLQGRLVERGIRLQCLGTNTHVTGERTSSLTTRVWGAIPFDLALSAHISPEDWFRKVQKLFGKELQVGDPAFDDAMYIQTDTPDALAEALRSEGLRAAILHAVGTDGRPVEFEGGQASFETHNVATKDLPHKLRDLAIILHHLERHALEQRLPRQPELAHYPDLRKELDRAASGSRPHWPLKLWLLRSSLDDLDDIATLHERWNAASKGRLEIIRLRRCHVVSADLAPLARLTRVRVLELSDMPTARALPSLARLEALEDLRLIRCSIQDLSPLAGLPALTELWLQGCPVSDLTPLATIPSLRKLDLRGTQVRDLTPLQQLPQLEMLWVEGLEISKQQLLGLKLSQVQLELDPY